MADQMRDMETGEKCDLTGKRFGNLIVLRQTGMFMAATEHTTMQAYISGLIGKDMARRLKREKNP